MTKQFKIKESKWFENLCEKDQDKALIYMHQQDIENYTSKQDLEEIEEAIQNLYVIYAYGYKELGEHYLDEGLIELQENLHCYFDAERFVAEQVSHCYEEYSPEDIPGLSQNVFVEC